MTSSTKDQLQCQLEAVDRLGSLGVCLRRLLSRRESLAEITPGKAFSVHPDDVSEAAAATILNVLRADTQAAIEKVSQQIDTCLAESRAT